MTQRFIKDPGATLDYEWDWSNWLATDETITSATISAPSGLTLNSQSNTDTTATCWLTGGTPGVRYSVVCHIVTTDGRTDERSIFIDVQDR